MSILKYSCTGIMVLLWGWSFYGQTHPSITLKGITHIEITRLEGDLLFCKESNGFLQRMSLVVEKEKTGRYHINIRKNYDSIRPSEVKGKLIAVDSLIAPEKHPIGQQLFSKHGNTSLALEFKRGDGSRNSLTPLNDHLLLMQHYTPENQQKKTNRTLYETAVHPYFKVGIGQGKSIHLMVKKDLRRPQNIRFGGYIMFTAQHPLFGMPGTQFFRVKTSSQKRLDIFNELSMFDPQAYYDIRKVDGGYSIYSLFGVPVVKEVYDSIRVMKPLTIFQRGDSLQLCTPDMKPIPIKNPRAAYFYFAFDRRWLQILDGNQLKTINYVGNVVTNPEEEFLFVCGTVPHWRFALDRDENNIVYQSAPFQYFEHSYEDCMKARKKEQKIQKVDSLSGDTLEIPLPSVSPPDCFGGKKASIALLKTKHIHFIDGSEEVNYNSNYAYGSLFSLKQGLLNFQKNGKYGLAQPYWKGAKQDTLLVKELLPAVYDRIKYTGNHTPLLLSKDGLYAWYPMSENPRYKKVSPFDHHFSRYELPDGSKGWMDLKGNEYPDL